MRCLCLGWELRVSDIYITKFYQIFIKKIITENPVLLPVCDKKKSWVPSTNNQFQFEVESQLNDLLVEQYGEVLLIQQYSIHIAAILAVLRYRQKLPF